MRSCSATAIPSRFTCSFTSGRMTPMAAWTVAVPRLSALVAGAVFLFGGAPIAAHLQPVQPEPESPSPRAVVDQYCVSCHSARLRTAGLDLESLSFAAPAANAEAWEKIIAKLRAGSMPPPGRPRPDKRHIALSPPHLKEKSIGHGKRVPI